MKHALLSLLAATLLSSSHSLWAQAPQLLDTSPAPNALSAPRNTSLAFTFSDLMLAPSPSDSAVRVFSSLTGVHTGSFTGSGTSTLVFNPDQDFQPGEKVKVSVTRRVKSTAGDSLAQARVYDFTAKTAMAPAVFSFGAKIPAPISNSGSPNYLAQPADYDGDGDIDLLYRVPLNPNYEFFTPSDDSFYLNQGDGLHFTRTPIDSTQLVYVGGVGDFDGDGDVDLLAYARTDREIYVYLQKSPGHFVKGSIFPYIIGGCLLMDIDNDGDLDVANYGQTFLNDGAGHFTQIFYTGAFSHFIIPGDFDNDGDVDIVGSENIGTGSDGEDIIINYLYLNDGQGRYPTKIAAPSAQNAADLDEDGDLDLIHWRSSTISIHLNDGQGHFSLGKQLPLQNRYLSHLNIADCDGDGRVDLLAGVADGYSGQLLLMRNEGNLNFTTVGSTDREPIIKASQSLGDFNTDIMADFNGDGRIDLVASLAEKRSNGSGYNFSMAVLLNQRPRTTYRDTQLNAYVGVDFPISFTFDGFPWDTDVLTAQLSDATGSFTHPITVGSLSGRYRGTINALIPEGIEPGPGYRIRIVSAQGNIAYDSTGISLIINAPDANPGKILREYWANVGGNETVKVPVNMPPTSTRYLTSFEAPSNVADRYASRVRGYIYPTETGHYTFWIAADDYGDLYLSTDENPANKTLIAYIKGYAAPRQWNKHYSQKSALIHLEKGKRYYIEALQKEDYINDNLAVAWRLPYASPTSAPVVIPGSVLSPFVPGSARQEVAAETTPALSLAAYPNPFTNQVTVSFTAKETGRAVLELYDMQGVRLRSLFEGAVKAGQSEQVTVDGSGLNRGLYLLRLTDGVRVHHLKLVHTK